VVDGLQSPWVVKSIVYHGSDIIDRQIDVVEKEQFRDIRITITDASSLVSGIVEQAPSGPTPPAEAARPVANAGVLVFPRVPLFWMRTSRRMRVAYTDDSGRFTLPGLPAGEYLAVASMSIDEGDLGRRNRLRALESIGVPFRLESDEARATVTLQLALPGPVAAAGVR
jgi:hypothetical protein